ncbi:MAG: carbohydrate kinase family protein, partial [Desulfovibrionaceae bacterium]|nr:carbohydrate kinase family protein [Desulfovibrionaceae bacterium]
IHRLNVSFSIGKMDEKRGGTGGNIAYNLALLGEPGILLASVGRDFGPYEAFLRRAGLSLEGLRRLPDEFTAGAYITTDLQDNQITAFHSAAMNMPCGYVFPALDPAVDLGIIAPTNNEDMEEHAKFYRSNGIRYIFDPGQQIIGLSLERLLAGINGAAMLVSNDYELELILNMFKADLSKLLELVPVVITTLGHEGSRISRRGMESAHIQAARAAYVHDPTGAGDAYRAGLIKGLLHGLPLEECACLGSVCASFCVERLGTQEHYYDSKAVAERLLENYGLRLGLDFTPLFAGDGE